MRITDEASVSILYKSIVGRYRPVRVAGPLLGQTYLAGPENFDTSYFNVCVGGGGRGGDVYFSLRIRIYLSLLQLVLMLSGGGEMSSSNSLQV